METTILKKIQGRKMEMLFDYNGLNFMIKHYEAVNVNDERYNSQNVYQFRILIRHPEDTSADELFESAYRKMFESRPEKIQKKKIFFVSTEIGRVKGRISFYIAEILPNKGLRLIDNFYTCSATSHRGLDTEAVHALVKAGEIPASSIHKDGYINNKNKKYILIKAEGRSLVYINQIL
jgi:hypothetical protein